MRKLLEFIVKGIVAKSEDVVVNEEVTDATTIMKLKVADDDFGSIIGKNGRMVRAIRDLLRVKAQKEGIKYNLLIDEPKPRPEQAGEIHT